MDTCAPTYWFLAASEQGRYFDRLGNKEAIIPESQLLDGRAAGWTAQNEATWEIADPKFMLSAYTSGNRVTALVDGEAYVKSLAADLSAQIKDGSDFVLMTGWQFSNDFNMAAGDEATAATELSEIIRQIAARNNTTRALVMKLPLPLPQNGPFVDALNVIYSPAAPTGNPLRRVAYLDGIGGGFAFSHHQKEVFVGFKNFAQCRAYVGGIDLALDRRDNPKHEKTKKDSKFYGWHDVQVRVEGNALQALWANFAERWNSADRILGKAASPSYRLRPCPVPAFTDSTPGSQHVQVLRTVATASKSDRQRFMPDGELTVLAGLAKAIRNAECYIYIEEQFLWDCELADLIGAQLEANKELRLIIMLAAESEFPPGPKQYSFYMRSQFLMRVMRVDSAAQIAFGSETRVYVYGLYQALATSPKAVYVHSKLFIIDDRYVAVGSANVDRRSMRIETELTLGIVDGTTVQSTLGGTAANVCKFAKDLREQLWMEHLGLSGAANDPTQTLPADPIQALQRFPGSDSWPVNQAQAKQKAIHHARCYVNIAGNDLLPVVFQRILDRPERRYRSARGGA